MLKLWRGSKIFLWFFYINRTQTKLQISCNADILIGIEKQGRDRFSLKKVAKLRISVSSRKKQNRKVDVTS